jgi:nucleoside-diphosphate-sugar epimerase
MSHTILVAGATGAIGMRLLPMLVARGHRVFGLTRSENKMDVLRGHGAMPLLADVFDAVQLGSAMRAAQPDVFMHLPSCYKLRCNHRWRRIKFSHSH